MLNISEHSECNSDRKNGQPTQKKERYANYILHDFISHSTLHGFHYIFERRPTIQRIVWLILLICMFGLFTWQTSTLISKYFEYRVTSRVQIVYNRQSIFPAVTICNFNRYRKSIINNTELGEIVRLKNPLYKKNLKPVNWTAYPKVNKMNMENEIRLSGHQLKYNKTNEKGMLYRCRWKGQHCDESNFTSTLTEMGLCYTFNSGKNGETLKVGSPGNNFGLKLTMAVEQDEYMGRATFSAGLKIRVHEQGEPPLVNGLGFAVMPGSHVFASISRERIISLKYPYETMCQDQKLFDITSNTIAACHDTCKEHMVTEMCKCRAYYMRDRHFPLCSVQEYYECIAPKEEEFNSLLAENCKCAEPCDSTKYHAYLSYGLFPSKASNELYANFSKQKMDKYSRTNILSIDIFYENLYYNLMEQVPQYELQNLLGEIGGLLGLFLGASTLTLFEVIDVILSTVFVRLGIHRPR